MEEISLLIPTGQAWWKTTSGLYKNIVPENLV